MINTTLVPAIVRVRACREGLFAGQAAFGRYASKTERIYEFKVALSVSPEGVITSFGLAEANCDERPAGEFLVDLDGHYTYLADKGFSSVYERLASRRLESGRSSRARSTSSGTSSHWSVTGPRPCVDC